MHLCGEGCLTAASAPRVSVVWYNRCTNQKKTLFTLRVVSHHGEGRQTLLLAHSREVECGKKLVTNIFCSEVATR
jgi:hypothetical protein